jgi:outer membrane protein TolC
MKFISSSLNPPSGIGRFLLIWLLGIPIVFAQEPVVSIQHSLTAEDAVQLALRQNPDLLAAEHLLAEATGRSRTTGRLANPEVEAEIAGGQDSEGRIKVGLTQRFPLTSRLTQERKISAKDIEIATWEIRDRRHRLAAATRSAFYELAAAREAVALADRQVDFAQTFAKSLQEAVTQGFGSVLDSEQAALEADVLRSEATTLEASVASANGRLTELLGLPANTPLKIKNPFALPQKRPSPRPSGVRPDVKLAELMAEAGQLGVSLARSSRWDDVGLGVFWEGERFADEPEGIEPEGLFGIQVSLPIPLWQNGSGAVSEKQAAAARKQAEWQARQLAAANQIESAYRALCLRYDAATRATAKLVPAAKKQMQDAEVAHSRGELEIQSIFRARERLMEIEAKTLEAQKAYFLSYAAWLEALGEPTNP